MLESVDGRVTPPTSIGEGEGAGEEEEEEDEEEKGEGSKEEGVKKNGWRCQRRLAKWRTKS